MTKKQKLVLYRIIIAALLMIFVWLLPVEGAVKGAAFLLPYLVIGYDILRKAVLGIFHGEIFDENFLMAVATVGAMLLGEYMEGVAVMLFYQIGELFQSVAVGKSRRNITALMDICPEYANIEDGSGALRQVDPEEVETGAIIVVCPGERVPIDGIVIEGSSSVNTSALTGESVPRRVKAGDSILSGCVNESGVLKIRTEKEFSDSTVSKILDLVENSSMKKARTEKFITKFAKYYTPAVCCSALVLAVLPPIVQLLLENTAQWQQWITRALTFLVISCPCALVISIPLSFFGGIGGASTCGILVKGSNYLEILSQTKYVIFDKTGTLTKGVFEVTGCYPDKTWIQACTTEEQAEKMLLEYAAYAEGYSKHPISKSLRDAYGKEIDYGRLGQVEEIGGHGVVAQVDDRKIFVGNKKLMKKIGIVCEEDAAGTVVYVAVDEQYAGHLLIADVIKENAKEAIAGLKAAGVEKTIMLTGDNRAAAEYVAGELGLDEFYCNLLPEDKVQCIEQILAKKGAKQRVAFVGDGINDAPVLSRADIGIAMGALGQDAAIEAADIVLMDDNLKKIVLAMRISGKTLKIVYQNIVFALSVKSVCLILGAMGMANMWLAIFADVGVMVLAVLNAVRCLKVSAC